MYIVIYKTRNIALNGVVVNKFEHLDEAQDFIKDLVREGITDVTLSEEIPFRLKIDVEF